MASIKEPAILDFTDDELAGLQIACDLANEDRKARDLGPVSAGDYLARRVKDVVGSYAKQHVEDVEVKKITDALNSEDPVERKAAREAARSGLEAAKIDVEAQVEVQK